MVAVLERAGVGVAEEGAPPESTREMVVRYVEEALAGDCSLQDAADSAVRRVIAEGLAETVLETLGRRLFTDIWSSAERTTRDRVAKAILANPPETPIEAAARGRLTEVTFVAPAAVGAVGAAETREVALAPTPAVQVVPAARREDTSLIDDEESVLDTRYATASGRWKHLRDMTMGDCRVVALEYAARAKGNLAGMRFFQKLEKGLKATPEQTVGQRFTEDEVRQFRLESEK